MDVCTGHGVADYPEEESGGLVAYEIGIEIERGFRVLVRRRGKSGRHPVEQQGQATDGSRDGSGPQRAREKKCA